MVISGATDHYTTMTLLNTFKDRLKNAECYLQWWKPSAEEISAHPVIKGHQILFWSPRFDLGSRIINLWINVLVISRELKDIVNCFARIMFAEFFNKFEA